MLRVWLRRKRFENSGKVSTRFSLKLAHRKAPIVFYGYRGFLIARFGMKPLQAVGKAPFNIFTVPLAPALCAGFRSPVRVTKRNKSEQISPIEIGSDLFLKSFQY